MRKQMTFDLFGSSYRIRQMAATEGLKRLESEKPMEEDAVAVLAEAEAHVFDSAAKQGRGAWVPLGSAQAVDTYVKDCREGVGHMFMLRPQQVLQHLLSAVHNHNFSFAAGWSFVKFPKRLQAADIAWEPPKEIGGLILSLMSSRQATLKELQTFYSVEDAYFMQQAMASDSLRSALLHEDAMKEAEAAAKRRH
jgi:hypothetical protein